MLKFIPEVPLWGWTKEEEEDFIAARTQNAGTRMSSSHWITFGFDNKFANRDWFQSQLYSKKANDVVLAILLCYLVMTKNSQQLWP